MCGIAGRVNLFTAAPVDGTIIRGMCDRLSHRGPDDEGVLVKGLAGFGHRRLSIIDLSPAGHQPMISPSGRYWITFNGEIYNYREIRRQLEARGVVFRSATDTEVLLAAYEAYGPSCLKALRGMFAFAVWDTQDRQLFVARDRVGKKPLFYRLDRDGLAFASESKAFFADPQFEARPNLTAISAFLSLQYVPSPMSAFEGVRALPPAHYLVATADGVDVHRYWQLEYEPKSDLTEDDATDGLNETLREAVRLRMISDVPLGVFLSGGLDSSIIVALMCELGGHASSVKTFSIGFEEKEFDELPYARLVADRYHTDHHEFRVRPDIRDLLPRLALSFGEPLGDSAALPTFCLSELTRQHVTVALNGDGGDESFAGYDQYGPHPRNDLYARLPQSWRVSLAATISRFSSDQQWGLPMQFRRWAQFHALPGDERTAAGRFLMDDDMKRGLCTPEFLAAAGENPAVEHLMDALRRASATEPLDRLLSADVETYLPGALLPKVDIATMAFGLEGRSPLLDHKFMEFCARLPVDMKRRRRNGKRILKRVASRMLPQEILERPKKGFSVPLVQWFRNELADILRDVLLGSQCRNRGWLTGAAVERLIRDHSDGVRTAHEQIWILLMLELWSQSYLDTRHRGLEAESLPRGLTPHISRTRLTTV